MKHNIFYIIAFLTISVCAQTENSGNDTANSEVENTEEASTETKRPTQVEITQSPTKVATTTPEKPTPSVKRTTTTTTTTSSSSHFNNTSLQRSNGLTKQSLDRRRLETTGSKKSFGK